MWGMGNVSSIVVLSAGVATRCADGLSLLCGRAAELGEGTKESPSTSV